VSYRKSVLEAVLCRKYLNIKYSEEKYFLILILIIAKMVTSMRKAIRFVIYIHFINSELKSISRTVHTSKENYSQLDRAEAENNKSYM
jgi:hypothetical protein